MILSRFVNPRARRMADMHASVPELHIRTFCTLGTHEQIILANVTSNGFGMPKVVPFCAGARTAVITPPGMYFSASAKSCSDMVRGFMAALSEEGTRGSRAKECARV